MPWRLLVPLIPITISSCSILPCAASGGLEDRGMMIAMFYMTDLSDLLGLHEVDNKNEATFIAEENEFGSYFDCETINELSTLIYSVCNKLNQPK